MAKHDASSNGDTTMSFKLVAAVFDMKVGNPLRKMVLIKLADQANDDGVCWPSYESIARSCEISRRSVVTHIQWLEDNGFLWIERRYNAEESKNFSNRYHLTLSKAKQFKKPKTKRKGSANAAPVQIASDDANAALGDAGNALGSATDAPSNSAGAAPEPIIKSINESINEAERENDSDNSAEKAKDSNAEFIVNWQPPARETMEAKLLMAGTPMQMTDGQYQLYVDDFKAHFEERAKDGYPLKSDGKCQAKLRDWLQRERDSHIKNNQSQQTNYQGNNNANHQSDNSQYQPKLSQADSYAANLDAQLAAERAAREREYS